MTFVGLPERIEDLASTRGDTIAVSGAGSDVTYRELDRKVSAITAALRNELGVRAGDRVGWIGLNDPAQLASLAALMRIGAIMVPLNYRLAAAELARTLADAGASLLIADDTFASIASTLGVRSIDRDSLWSSATDDASAPASHTDPLAAGLIVYTSGTTGRPKGAVHTNAMLHANALASDAFHRFRDDDIVLTALPMFHVGGLCIQTIPALYRAVRLIIHPRFDARDWLETVARERVTISLMVPATIRAVQEHAQWSTTDLSSLRMLGAGSSTIPLSLIARCHARNVPVCQIYGATETGPFSIALTARHAFSHAGSCGWPAEGVEVRLDEAPAGVGELLVRGPNVVARYWPDRPALDAEGWFQTGDMGQRADDGSYTVVGRRKDMIISGGENIYPAEIENLLAGHPAVAECAVVGLADASWGEVVVAALVARPGCAATDEELLAFLAARIARYKLPRRIVWVDALPKTALGKVQKPQLVSRLKA